jgi:UDP-glucose 4-epimerase
VDDVVDAMLLAATTDDANGHIFNLGSDETISLRDLAAVCVEVNQSGRFEVIPFPPDRKPIDIGDYYGNYQKIRGALGWRPSVTLRDGLARTLEYYRENKERYW